MKKGSGYLGPDLVRIVLMRSMYEVMIKHISKNNALGSQFRGDELIVTLKEFGGFLKNSDTFEFRQDL